MWFRSAGVLPAFPGIGRSNMHEVGINGVRNFAGLFIQSLGGLRLSVCLYSVIALDSALCHGSQGGGAEAVTQLRARVSE